MGKREGKRKQMPRAIKSKSLISDDYTLRLNEEEMEAVEILHEDFMSGDTLEKLVEKEVFTEYEVTVLKGITSEILKQKK
tara:strand:+ start:4999 stop:5238 length:240 start_codon:yes stop_codon:yes gene_type:complete